MEAEAGTLRTQLDEERAEAVQHLLRHPVLNVGDHAETYSLVARHGPWLVEWFDQTCGWALHIDLAAGYARLAKRQPSPDPTRPLRRPRGTRGPFDRRRYELLCLLAAELISRPMTTIGLLAEAMSSATDFATDKQRDRAAFVDALLVLSRWGAVTVTSGELEDYAGDEHTNALLAADLSRLHRLLASTTAPSTIGTGSTFTEALDALLAEPRYEPDLLESSDPHRSTRHHLARRLLDDPVVHLDDCIEEERAYLASGAGRTWLRSRVAEAGFLLEERADGLLAIDLGARATDNTFPGPNGTVYQMALLLIDHLVDHRADSSPGDGGEQGEEGVVMRRPRARSMAELAAATADRLARHRSWAKAYRDEGGAERLAAEAVEVLASFGLVRVQGTTVEARPAICRYLPGDAPAPEPPVGPGNNTAGDNTADDDAAAVATSPHEPMLFSDLPEGH